jgi:hypothetical protein
MFALCSFGGVTIVLTVMRWNEKEKRKERKGWEIYVVKRHIKIYVGA